MNEPPHHLKCIQRSNVAFFLGSTRSKMSSLVGGKQSFEEDITRNVLKQHLFINTRIKTYFSSSCILQNHTDIQQENTQICTWSSHGTELLIGWMMMATMRKKISQSMYICVQLITVMQQCGGATSQKWGGGRD